MKKYKVIILGPQCSGKTTLKKFLITNHDLPLIEEDELFTDLNGGEYPKDIDYKEKILRPKLHEKICESDSIIFLTSYCDSAFLKELRSRDFKIMQLILDKDEFDKRNKNRMEKEGYDDARVWADQIFDFHDRMWKEGMIDIQIDAHQPTEVIARQILEYLS